MIQIFKQHFKLLSDIHDPFVISGSILADSLKDITFAMYIGINKLNVRYRPYSYFHISLVQSPVAWI